MSLRYIYGNGIIIASASLDLDATSSATPLFYIGSSALPNNRSLEITIPSGSTGGDKDTTALFITSSGKNPFIGIGTQDPRSTLDIKDVKDSKLGTKFLLQSARSSSLGAQVGDSAGSIFFSIDSGSYNDPFTTGSITALKTIVTNLSTTGSGQSSLNSSGVFRIDASPVNNNELYNVVQVGFFPGSNFAYQGDTYGSATVHISGSLIIHPNPDDTGQQQGDIVPFEVWNRPSITTGQESLQLYLTGSNLVLNSGSLYISQSLTSSGLYYPDTDGTDGQVITTDGAGNLSFQTIEDVYVTVKNVSGGTLAKGTPVHATSSVASGNATPVIAASASNALTMPATFVLNEQIIDEAEGQALLSGFIQGVNTSLFEVGEIAYVGENGGFTNVKPTGSSNLIQNLGIVTKVHATNGSGWVYGSGRSNDVPNLPTGKIWVGSDSYTVTSSVITLDETNTKLTVEGSGSTIFDVVGSQGQLFSITDSLSGSLFTVSDISGLPILEVFSDDTVKMGTFNSEAIIVSGSNATITGSFTGSFIGDGSGLTGVGTVDTTGTPSNNQIAIFTDADTIKGVSDFTFDAGALVVEGGGTSIFNNQNDDATFQIKGSSDDNLLQVNPQSNDRIGIGTATPGDKLGITGGISLTGDISGNGSTLKVSEIASAIGAAGSAGQKGLNAETVTFYSTTVIAGYVYYLGASAWASSDADAVSTSKGFMGVATSTNSNTGMVIRGIVYMGADPGGSVGDVVYLSTATGRLTTDISGFTTGDVVRIMGYKVGTNLVFFDPSKDWIELDS